MKKINLEKIGLIGVKIYVWVFLLTVVPNALFAQSFEADGFTNPIGAGGNIGDLISAILDIVVQVGVVVVVLALIYSGFLFIVARGNEEKINKAKMTFMWTVIGAVILLGAQALSDVVCNTAKEFDGSISC